MIVLDASVVIAHLSRHEPHHRRANNIIAAAPALRMHTMTMAEVLVGALRAGRHAEVMDRLTLLGVVEQSGRDDEALALARLRLSTGLKLPDCCVVLAAETGGAAVATFDDRLARAARSRGVEVLDGGDDRGSIDR